MDTLIETIPTLIQYVADCDANALPRPTVWPVAGAKHGLVYDTDEDDEEFILIGYNLPQDQEGRFRLYAEIDDGTFGTLQGIRVYRGQP